MFRNLTNFAYKRTPKEALGFYFANIAVVLVLIILAGVPLALLSGSVNTFQEGFNSTYKLSRELAPTFWPIFSVMYSSVLSFLLLKEKRLFKNRNPVSWAITSVVLSGFGTVILGPSLFRP